MLAIPNANNEQQRGLLIEIRDRLQDMMFPLNARLRLAIVREYLPSIANIPNIANNAQQLPMWQFITAIIWNILIRPATATTNLRNVSDFLQMVQIACDNPRYARVFQRSLSLGWGNVNNAQRLQRLNSVLNTILRLRMERSILRNANNAQLSRRLVLL